MRLGYACTNTQLPSAARTLRLARVTPERIHELSAANLEALVTILRWNAEHDIQVFRITSDLIPFGSHEANTFDWRTALSDELHAAGELIRESGARISMHPGQYTVLSSQQPHVVERAIDELEYHASLLCGLDLDASHKIVLHVGSGAADVSAAGARFAAAYARLSPAVQARLVLEHDERWPLADVLGLAEPLAVPVVFDAFHHELAPSLDELDLRAAVLRTAETWRNIDGRQEVHFSTQQPGKRPGAHAEQLDLEAFAAFAGAVGDLPLDCVLEVKDKEQSVLRARPLLAPAATW